METTSHWPWTKSLAVARSGQACQVDRILFGTVQSYCRHLGIRQGCVLTCGEQGDEWVDVTLPSGEQTRLPRHYAWFVSVDAVSDPVR